MDGTEPATTSPWVPPPGRPARLPRWARGALVVFAVVGTLTLAFVLYVAASFSGGLDNLLDFSHPSADDASVRRAKSRGVATAVAEAAALQQLVARVGIAPVTATGAGYDCQEGQHNFKIDDDYDLRCVARQVLVLTPTAGDVAAQRLAMHQALLSDGWTLLYGPPGDGRPFDAAVRTRSSGYRRAGNSLTVASDGFFAFGFPRIEGLADEMIAPPGTYLVAIALDVETFRD